MEQIHFSKSTAPLSRSHSDTSLSTERVSPDYSGDIYDDAIPGLIEKVTSELGAELATDWIARDSNEQTTTQDRIEEAIKSCNEIAFCVRRLLSPAITTTTTADGDMEVSASELEFEALRGELKAETLLLGRLCLEITQDLTRYDHRAVRTLGQRSKNVIAMCHPYELPDIARVQPLCNPQQLVVTRLSALYELEQTLTHLSTLIPNNSLWNFILQSLARFCA